jgi:hypothetical protein
MTGSGGGSLRDPLPGDRRRVRVRWARVAGLGAVLVSGIAVGGPLLAAAGADVDGHPETTDLSTTDAVDWQQVALAAQAELRRTRARERRSRHRARRRGHVIRKLQAALRAQVRLGGASGLERGFLCVHEFEGSWRDPHAPYWGGLQMDWSFMRAYAPEFLRAFGPADNWTPAMQIATAERAHLSGRGFTPWPTTRRMCGL